MLRRSATETGTNDVVAPTSPLASRTARTTPGMRARRRRSLRITRSARRQDRVASYTGMASRRSDRGLYTVNETPAAAKLDVHAPRISISPFRDA